MVEAAQVAGEVVSRSICYAVFAERAAGPGRAPPLRSALWAREKGGKIQRLSRAFGGLAEALGGDRAPCRVHLLDTS